MVKLQIKKHNVKKNWAPSYYICILVYMASVQLYVFMYWFISLAYNICVWIFKYRLVLKSKDCKKLKLRLKLIAI